MGSSQTKAEKDHEKQWKEIYGSFTHGNLNKAQRDYLVSQRNLLESHLEQLLKLAGHTLPESDIKKACELAVLWGMSLKELRRAYETFNRMSSTIPRYCTVHEMCVYFNVRRTALMEMCLGHFYKSERLTFPQLLETLAAFCTCDHMELLEELTLSCALRGQSTLESVLTAIHGSPFEGDIEALLVVLGKLETLSTDFGTFDRQLNMPICSTEKLVDLNHFFPSLLYPTFKLQAGLREKFLGKAFWNRMRERMTQLGLWGMFSLDEYRIASRRWEPKQVYLLSGKGRGAQKEEKKRITAKSSVSDILNNGALERIRNYRIFKTCSIVDMNEDDSRSIAWELSCSALAKSLAVEIVLNDEEARAKDIAQRSQEFYGRLPSPEDPQVWIELKEGLYRPKLWRVMADKAGYGIAKRIEKGFEAFNRRQKDREKETSRLLKVIANQGQKEKPLSDAEYRALRKKEQEEIDRKLERKQREEWDIYWRSFIDPRSRCTFYFNYLTGERSWEKPRGFGRQFKSTPKTFCFSEEPSKDIIQGSAKTVHSIVTPSQRRRSARLQSSLKADLLAKKQWGADSPKRKGIDTSGSKYDKEVDEKAAGQAQESVPLYEGNKITVVTGASAYRVVTEKAIITKVGRDKLGKFNYSLLYSDGFREDNVERLRLIAY